MEPGRKIQAAIDILGIRVLCLWPSIPFLDRCIEAPIRSLVVTVAVSIEFSSIMLKLELIWHTFATQVGIFRY